MKSYRMPYENESVTRVERGAYAFKLTFPSDIDLGLYSKISIARIKSNLRDSVIRFVSAHEQKSASGRLQTDRYGTHLRETYSATIKPDSIVTKIKLQLDSILMLSDDVETIAAASNAIRAAIANLNPIYVGICRKQSFYARLQNHLDGQTNLANRLIEKSLRWEDLSFHCFPLNVHSQLDVRRIEKLIQMINLPICSEI